MWVKKHQLLLAQFVCAGVIFVIFYRFSSLVPLLGDDWEYANQAEIFGVIGKAIELYQTWSGRFFSDAYTLYMCGNKGIWNFVNAALFAGSYLLMNFIGSGKKNRILVVFLSFLLMLGINRDIRIEVYFWINGGHFTLPLFLMLLYFSMCKVYFIEEKHEKLLAFPLVLIGFVGSLCSENATVIMVVGTILILFYCWKTKPNWNKYKALYLLVVSIPTIVMFTAPGMKNRLLLENADWAKYSIFQKISMNWSSMITNTFAGNTILMIVLALSLFLATRNFQANQKHRMLNRGHQFINSFVILVVIIEGLFRAGRLQRYAVILDYSQSPLALVLISIVFILFVISVFIEVYRLFGKEVSKRPLFYLILAVCGNASLMMSPSFQPRSSIYTVYLLGIVTMMILDKVQISQILQITSSVLILFVCAGIIIQWNGEYRAVHEVQVLRDEQITYYQDHWMEKEIYMPRFPSKYVHGGDIEEGDTFHKLNFLHYYDMNPLANLYFYKLPQYMDE